MLETANLRPPFFLELALEYAKGDAQTTSELRQALKQTKPYSCMWRPGALVRDALGDNKFGKVIFDPGLKPHPGIAGSGGRIDCAKAQGIRKDKKGMAPVRMVLNKSLIAVEKVDGQDWTLNTNALGQPTSKTRIVRIYEKVPPLPPLAVSLEQFKQQPSQ